MADRKMWIRLFTIADYEEEERWLRQQQNRGWKLVNMLPPCFYIFQRCQPEDVVYRLDFQPGVPEDGYMQMFAEYGWEFCHRFAGWLYFRKPVSKMELAQEAEIFSDDGTKLERIHQIIRTRMLPVLAVFLICVVPQWVLCIQNAGEGGGMALCLIFSFLALLYLYLIGYCGLKLRSLRRRYQKNT